MPPAEDRGSAPLELALVTPAVIALFALVVLGGRIVTADAAVDHASRAAARAATSQRSAGAAQEAAETTASALLGGPDSPCDEMSVDVDLAAFEPGGLVAVVVRCQVELSDLSVLPVPGHRELTATGLSVLDRYRGVT